MAKYYAVERSDEYLAHYGVKGMRWGVRKARERGNEKALDRQWRKANRKQKRLNKKADWAHQQKLYKAGAGLTGYGSMVGGMVGSSLTTGDTKKLTPAEAFKRGALGGAAGGLVGGLPGAIMLESAKRKLGSKGHAEALKKSRDWTKEMNRAFQGTKYQGKAKKFEDAYASIHRTYQPKEAKAGNAMPYVTTIKFNSGSTLASEFDKKYGRKRRRR